MQSIYFLKFKVYCNNLIIEEVRENLVRKELIMCASSVKGRLGWFAPRTGLSNNYWFSGDLTGAHVLRNGVKPLLKLVCH